MKTQITIGEVKKIASLVSKKYELVNRDIYYNIIDKKTRQSSIEGGDKNLVSSHLYQLVEFEYLKIIGENGLFFDWQVNGVNTTLERKSYVFKIKNKIVELLCGYKF